VKTDSLFYQIFLRFPDSFFDLIGQPQPGAANYQFTSQEVKQLSFRLDGLFMALREDIQQPLYLVEVQFQPDDTLYY
jgi:predicted transposase YdaD